MKAENLSQRELREETRRLLTNLSKRISHIEGLETAPKYAVNRFRDIEKNVPSSLTQLSEKDLRNLYRDLRYVNQLKSSTVKGATEVENVFEPIKRKIESLQQENQRKVFGIYERFFETVGGLASHYKYEVLDYATEAIQSIGDEDEALINLIKEFDKIYRVADENATDTETRLLLSQKLKDLLQ